VSTVASKFYCNAEITPENLTPYKISHIRSDVSNTYISSTNFTAQNC